MPVLCAQSSGTSANLTDLPPLPTSHPSLAIARGESRATEVDLVVSSLLRVRYQVGSDAA